MYLTILGKQQLLCHDNDINSLRSQEIKYYFTRYHGEKEEIISLTHGNLGLP